MLLVWTTVLLAATSAIHAGPIPRSELDPDYDSSNSNTNTTTTTEAGAFGGDKYVCLTDDIEYRDGDVVPAQAQCHACVCRAPEVVCQPIKCETKPGCLAIMSPGRCCPEYKCECERDGRIYGNGEKLAESAQAPCDVCYCRGGDVVCTPVTCYTRDDCTPRSVPGRCCPKYDHCPPVQDNRNNSYPTTMQPTIQTTSFRPSLTSSAVQPEQLHPSWSTPTHATSDDKRSQLLDDMHADTEHPFETPGTTTITALSDDSRANTRETTLTEHGTDRDTRTEVDPSGNEATIKSSTSVRDSSTDDSTETATSATDETPDTPFTADLVNTTETVLDDAVVTNDVTTLEDEAGAFKRIEFTTPKEDDDNSTELEGTTISPSEDGDSSTTDTSEATTLSAKSTRDEGSETTDVPSGASEPWEHHRPTQMVTDDIQYVTTLQPPSGNSSPDASSTAVGVNASPEDESSTEGADENVTDSTEISQQTGVEESTTTSSRFDNLAAADEGSTIEDEEVTVVPAKEVKEKMTTLNLPSGSEDLAEAVTATVDLQDGEENVTKTEELESNAATTEISSTATEMTTESAEITDSNVDGHTEVVLDKQADGGDVADELPVLKLSEEMSHHQMDTVIHQISLPGDDGSNEGPWDGVTEGATDEIQTTTSLSVDESAENSTDNSGFNDTSGSTDKLDTTEMLEDASADVSSEQAEGETTQENVAQETATQEVADMDTVNILTQSPIEERSDTVQDVTEFSEDVTSSTDVTSSPESLSSSSDMLSSPKSLPNSPEDVTSSSEVVTSSSEDVASSSGDVTSSTDVTSSPESVSSSSDLLSSPKSLASSPEDVTSSSEVVTSSSEDVTSSSEDVTSYSEDVTSSSEDVSSYSEDVSSYSEDSTSSSDEVTSVATDAKMQSGATDQLAALLVVPKEEDKMTTTEDIAETTTDEKVTTKSPLERDAAADLQMVEKSSTSSETEDGTANVTDVSANVAENGAGKNSNTTENVMMDAPNLTQNNTSDSLNTENDSTVTSTATDDETKDILSVTEGTHEPSNATDMEIRDQMNVKEETSEGNVTDGAETDGENDTSSTSISITDGISSAVTTDFTNTEKYDELISSTPIDIRIEMDKDDADNSTMANIKSTGVADPESDKLEHGDEATTGSPNVTDVGEEEQSTTSEKLASTTQSPVALASEETELEKGAQEQEVTSTEEPSNTTVIEAENETDSISTPESGERLGNVTELKNEEISISTTTSTEVSPTAAEDAKWNNQSTEINQIIEENEDFKSNRTTPRGEITSTTEYLTEQTQPSEDNTAVSAEVDEKNPTTDTNNQRLIETFTNAHHIENANPSTTIVEPETTEYSRFPVGFTEGLALAGFNVDETSTLREDKREAFVEVPVDPLQYGANPGLDHSNNGHIFTDLPREDAHEIGKYDLVLLQNFFKNLYISNAS